MFCLYYTGVTPAERYASIINSLHQPLQGIHLSRDSPVDTVLKVNPLKLLRDSTEA